MAQRPFRSGPVEITEEEQPAGGQAQAQRGSQRAAAGQPQQQQGGQEQGGQELLAPHYGRLAHALLGYHSGRIKADELPAAVEDVLDRMRSDLGWE